jgi:LPS-assembly protein
MTARETRLLVLLPTILFLLNTGVTEAQTSQSGPGGDGQRIEVTADKLSAAEGGTKVEASGNVEIRRDQMTLKADELRVDRDTQDVEAKGKVSMDAPEWKVRSADSVQFNLGRETGEGRNADIFIEQGHVSITGGRFQKFEGQAFRVDDLFFTTCLCESGVPHWKFSAEQMDLSADGVGTIRNGYFYVLDVPVFYLPYGFFPLRTERQTGFLFPTFGSSTKEGFRFQQPFFWAISKSTDATVSFDIQTRARVGVIGELRTLFDRNSDFQFTASYFNEALRKNEEDDIEDRTIADQRIPEDRWNVVSTHRYRAANDWLTYSDIAAYGDDLFTRELAERFDIPGEREYDIRVSRFSESRFGLFRNWRDMFVQGEGKFYQDFVQPDQTTLHRTPQIAFWGRRFLGAIPMEFRWRGEAVNYTRRVGGDGLRVDLRPELVLPFRMASEFFGSLSVAPRETAYHLYTPVKASERNLSRELVELRGQLGTTLNRVFAWSGLGLSAVKHVIEPELNYLFVPHANQSSIPVMDGTDRINRRNIFTLAITNRFWGKFANPLASEEGKEAELLNPVGFGGVRDLAHWRVAMGYDLDQERKGGDSLTDLDMGLRLNPTSYASVSFDGGVDPGAWQVTQARAKVALNDPRPILRRSLDADFNRPNSFSFSYSFLRRGPNAIFSDDANIDFDRVVNPPPPLPPPPGTDPYCDAHKLDPRCSGVPYGKNVVGNLGANLFLHLTDHVLLSLNGIYSVRDSRFLGMRAATKLLSTCECWSVTLGLRRSINPSKTSFNFDFNLLGVGSSRSALP